MTDFLIFLLALLPALWVSVFLHELGHVLLARRVGVRVSAFGLGFGKPLFVWNWRGMRVWVSAQRFSSGLTLPIFHQIYPEPRVLAWLFAGGFLVNLPLLLGGIAGWLWLPAAQPLWWAVVWWNALFVLITALPLETRLGPMTVRTDGALVLRLLRGEGLPVEPALTLEQSLGLLPLLDAIDDRLGGCVMRVQAAHLWLEFGEPERASALLEAARGAAVDEGPFPRGYLAVAEAALARHEERLAEAEALLAEAERAFAELPEPDGPGLLLEWARADLAAAAGQPAEAERRVAALAASPRLRAHPSIATALCLTRLQARLTTGDRHAVEEVVAAYEALPERHRPASVEQRLSARLCEFYAAAEDWPAAAAAAERALAATRSLYPQLQTPEVREAFVRAQEPWLARAREALERAGREDAEALLEGAFPEPEQLAAEAKGHARQRDRRWHRLGLLGTLPNAALGLALLTALAFGWVGEGAALLAVLLLVLAFFTWIWAALLGLGGLLIGKHRVRGGLVTAWLALMPWLGWAYTLAAGG